VERFEAALRQGLLRLGGRRGALLLAVSGGADSVAMLVGCSRLAGRLGLRLEAATVDHGLSATMAHACEAVVARCQGLGVPCHRRALALAQGAGLEERARRERYAALEAVRAERGLDAVATAHTADDQAETLLMRLGRGAALTGAAGVLERRGGLIRPLLRVRRQTARAYLEALGEAFVEDPMNADPQFLRTRVRGALLPAYEQLAGPGVAEHLARFAQLAAEDDALLQAQADEAFARVRLPDGRLEAVGVRALLPPLRRRVLKALLQREGVPVDSVALENVERALREGGAATLPGDLLLTVRGGALAVEAAPSRNFK
jgi:tRNA(Ile)-lysidine synthase